MRSRAHGRLTRVARGLTLGFFWLALGAANLWAVAALFFDLPPGWRLLGAGLYLAILLASFVMTRRLRIAAVAALGGFAVVLSWWLTLMPSDTRNWQPDVDRTAWAEIAGDEVTIHNVRNIDYRTETDFTPQWQTRHYNLAQLEALDLAITFWGSPWIAHPILSFQFADGQHLAISVETRKEVGESYSAIRGFFRQYELIYVLADERDVIRLRTNYRKGEEVYLYRTTVGPAAARAMLLDYLKGINELHMRPVFYNALTSNCTTNIRIHAAAATGRLSAWNWRLLLNGKSDEYAYERGLLVNDGLPFEELKRRAHINDAARAADQSLEFSALIRAGRPGFP